MLLGADELKRFTDLRRKLWVNGKLRQNVTAADMAHPLPMRLEPWPASNGSTCAPA